MFSRLFSWSMRNGAQILFAIALLIIVLPLGPYLYALFGETRRMAGDHSAYPAISLDATMLFTTLFTAVYSATLPFLGAVLITIANRFLENRNA